jgi:hypothetical protein
MPINVERCRQVRDIILFEPERHDQGSWITMAGSRSRLNNLCNTPACVAGHAAILSGLLVATRNMHGIWNISTVHREDELPYEPSPDYARIGVKALGLEEYDLINRAADGFKEHSPHIPLTTERCQDDECIVNCSHTGIGLFNECTSHADVVACLDWLIKTGEDGEATL